MKQFWKTDEDGALIEQVECAYLDGYAIGDRVLEGVAIKVTVTPRGKFKCEWLACDQDYVQTLNASYWLKLARESCIEDDDGEFYSDASLDEPDVVCIDPAVTD